MQYRIREALAPAAAARLLVSFALTLALLPAHAHAQRRVEVYTVKHRAAEEMVPIAETAIGRDGSVTVDRRTNALVLLGDAAAVADALELLAAQDRRPRTVVLRYDTRRIRELAEQGFEVHWTAKAGGFRIGNLARPRGSGSSLALSASEAIEKLTDSFTGTMRMTEGASTRIETGTNVPITTVGRSGASTEYVTAATGFESSARILGDGSVQVDLASFAGVLAGSGGAIETTSASTLVTVKPGETLAIAALARSSEAQRREAGGGARSASVRDETVLLLRAGIE